MGYYANPGNRVKSFLHNLPMPIETQLREAIRTSELSGNALAKAAGVSQSAVSRFMSGEDIRLSAASKLAEHFGLELRPADAKKPAKKKPKGS